MSILLLFSFERKGWEAGRVFTEKYQKTSYCERFTILGEILLAGKKYGSIHGLAKARIWVIMSFEPVGSFFQGRDI